MSFSMACKSVSSLLFENQDFWESRSNDRFKVKTLPQDANTWKQTYKLCRSPYLVPGIKITGDWTANRDYFAPLLSNPVFGCDSLRLIQVCWLNLWLDETVPEYLVHDSNRYFVYLICTTWKPEWEMEITAGPANDISKCEPVLTGGMRTYGPGHLHSALKLGPFSDRDFKMTIKGKDLEWKLEYVFGCVVFVSESTGVDFERQFSMDASHENIFHLKGIKLLL